MTDYESSDCNKSEELKIRSGMIWALAHWLLPATASKEDALELIEKARAEYRTGLDLKNRDSW